MICFQCHDHGEKSRATQNHKIIGQKGKRRYLVVAARKKGIFCSCVPVYPWYGHRTNVFEDSGSQSCTCHLHYHYTRYMMLVCVVVHHFLRKHGYKTACCRFANKALLVLNTWKLCCAASAHCFLPLTYTLRPSIIPSQLSHQTPPSRGPQHMQASTWSSTAATSTPH